MSKILIYNDGNTGESEIFQLLIEQKYSVNYTNNLPETEKLLETQDFSIIFLDLDTDDNAF